MFPIPFVPIVLWGALFWANRDRHGDAAQAPPRQTPALAPPPTFPALPRPQAAAPTQTAPTAMERIATLTAHGVLPDADLVFAAMKEAEDAGRSDMADALVRMFAIVLDRAGYVVESTAAETEHDRDVDARAPKHADDDPDAQIRSTRVVGGDEMDAVHAAMMAPGTVRIPADGSDATIVAGEIAAAIAPSASSSRAPRGGGASIQGAGTTASLVPIPGVTLRAWREFTQRVSREAVSFDAKRHVGQFRHRKDRLIEIGIDPAELVGNSDAQVDALDVDLADAYERAHAGGVIQVVGSDVAVPAPRASATAQVDVEITLSGLLGLIQAAGLHGAVDWIERDVDRVRFPHTTDAFLRTNGIF